MSHKPNLDQLENVVTSNKIPISDAGGVFGAKLLNNNSFLVGADIEVKGMGYSDVVAGIAPPITPTPPAAPANPGKDSILVRKYNDLIRTWYYNGTAWAHVFDEPIRNLGFINLTAVEWNVAVPGIGPLGDWFIVPAMLNGAEIIEAKATCGTGAGNTTLNVQINGFTPACLTFTPLTSAAVTTTVCGGIFLATNDIINLNIGGITTPPLNGASVTITYRLP